jgi:hypothetical protein
MIYKSAFERLKGVKEKLQEKEVVVLRNRNNTK